MRPTIQAAQAILEMSGTAKLPTKVMSPFHVPHVARDFFWSKEYLCPSGLIARLSLPLSLVAMLGVLEFSRQPEQSG